MHPNQQSIYDLGLNGSPKIRSFFKLIISKSAPLYVAHSFQKTLLLFTQVLCKRMHLKQQGIHALHLNHLSKL